MKHISCQETSLFLKNTKHAAHKNRWEDEPDELELEILRWQQSMLLGL